VRRVPHLLPTKGKNFPFSPTMPFLLWHNLPTELWGRGRKLLRSIGLKIVARWVPPITVGSVRALDKLIHPAKFFLLVDSGR